MTRFTHKSFEDRAKPDGIPVMHQDWRNMLFLHWKYPPEEIQKTLPPGLFVDTFEKSAYLTIAPFTIENLRIANVPSIPGFSNFVEVNFRTYVVDANGMPGIWFYSLDLNSFLGVISARNFYSLPYFFANFSQKSAKNEILLEGNRVDNPKIKMRFLYKPKNDEPFFAEEASLDFFLIERYILFSFSLNQLNLAPVQHQPYPLQRVETLEFFQSLDFPLGLTLLKEPDYMHYSSGVNVDIFGLKKDIIHREK